MDISLARTVATNKTTDTETDQALGNLNGFHLVTLYTRWEETELRPNAKLEVTLQRHQAL